MAFVKPEQERILYEAARAAGNSAKTSRVWAAANSQEARFVTVADGVVAQVVERQSVLPPRLDALIRVMTVTRRLPVRVRGAAIACRDQDHIFIPWIEGTYQARSLHLSTCENCGSVEVRDVSRDMLPLASTPLLAPRRRSSVLGWYSGRRAAGRIHL